MRIELTPKEIKVKYKENNKPTKGQKTLANIMNILLEQSKKEEKDRILVNPLDLAKKLNIHHRTVRKYLIILEKQGQIRRDQEESPNKLSITILRCLENEVEKPLLIYLLKEKINNLIAEENFKISKRQEEL